MFTDPFGLRADTIKIEGEALQKAWDHGVRVVSLAADRGDNDAKFILGKIREMERSPFVYTFQVGNPQGGVASTSPDGSRVTVSLSGVAEMTKNNVMNLSSTMLHEAGHAYYRSTALGQPPFGSVEVSDRWSLNFENPYRTFINWPIRTGHCCYPPR